jgi:hypothetical protein
MSFFRPINKWPSLKNAKSWRVVAISFFMASILQGCGGGSSSTPSVSDNPSSIVTPSGTVKSGVYIATSATGLKAITLIINGDSATSSTGQFFALQFNTPETQPQQPDLFSGTISGIGSGTAKINGLADFSTYYGTLKTGSATLTSVTQGNLKVDVTEGSTTLDWGTSETGKGNAKIDTDISMDVPANTSAMLGTWTGNLFYPTGGSNANFSITFAAAPSSSDPNNLSFSAPQFGIDCQLTLGKLAAVPSGLNLFSVSMTVPNATVCDLKNQSLSGVAFLATSPIAGKTKRLQWVATTSDGRGLSFRADR